MYSITNVVASILPSFMLKPLFWVLMLLLFAIWQFIRNKMRIDVIALIVVTCFGISGIMTPQEIIAGWGNPNIVLVALLFIISEGIVRTGLANRVSDGLFKIAGEHEVRIMCLLMFSVATLGSVMSSTGIVAIFIPVVLSICQRMEISPKRMMMPLSIAGLISGMMTLIATAPNLVANAALTNATGKGFDFFTFTPIGFVVLFVGIIYMLIARRWLMNDTDKEHEKEQTVTISQFMENYQLNGRMKLVLVEKNSDLIGRTIEALNLRVEYGVNIVSIERFVRFHRRLIAPFSHHGIRNKDILLVGVNTEAEFLHFCERFELRELPLNNGYFIQRSRTFGMAEVLVAPDSSSIGLMVKELSFRRRYGLSITGIKRDNEIIAGNVINTQIKAGDVLLILGIWQQLLSMEDKEKYFFILNTPKEIRNAVPASEQAPYAFASLAVMVTLMVSGLVPNVFAALIGCLMMGFFKCIDLPSAYKSIHWPLLILICGMMPFATALQRTGGIDLATHFLTGTLGSDVGPYTLLMLVFLMTALAGMVVSTTTSTILVLPIAISLAQQFGYSPEPFVMTVAIAASSAFLTPLTPVNTMILVPSGYTFTDFLKIGTPLMLLVMLVTTFVTPYFLPF